MSAQPAALAYSESATRILEVAERLVQERGFNGFSYATIAKELGVTKPSLHYHFPTKADLGAALITRYAERFAVVLNDMSTEDPIERLEGYVTVYRSVLAQGRMCLCGMLAAEYTTLPDPMQESVRAFFDLNEDWLSETLERGRRDGVLRFRGTSADTAKMIIDCLEGAVLVARPFRKPERFDRAAATLIQSLTAD